MNVGDPVRVVNPQGRLDLPLQVGTLTRITEVIVSEDGGELMMYRLEGSDAEFYPDELELVGSATLGWTPRLVAPRLAPTARPERPTQRYEVTISRYFDARSPSDAAQQMADWLIENSQYAAYMVERVGSNDVRGVILGHEEEDDDLR